MSGRGAGGCKEFSDRRVSDPAETQEGLTNLIVNQLLFDLPDDYLQTYRAMLKRSRPTTFMRVADILCPAGGDGDGYRGRRKGDLPQAENYAAVSRSSIPKEIPSLPDQEAAAN